MQFEYRRESEISFNLFIAMTLVFDLDRLCYSLLKPNQ